MNNKHLQEYSENDDNKVLDHIKNCDECKNQLLGLLKKNDMMCQQNSKGNVNEEGGIFGKINYTELKEIIILLMIGIIIIFIIDIFLRR